MKTTVKSGGDSSRRRAPRSRTDAWTGVVVATLLLAGLLAGCTTEPEPRPPPPPPPPAKAAAAPRPLGGAERSAMRGVNFDSNRSGLRRRDHPILDETVRFLKDTPAASLVAAGYTDDKESGPLKLSKQRATAVRDYLVQHDIAAGRIRVEGFGASDPVASNATAEGRAQNRRVELRYLE